MNAVDVTITPSGSASGCCTYYVDCTNDGSWEVNNVPGPYTGYTAVDACNYAIGGSYTVNGAWAYSTIRWSGTTVVTVYPVAPLNFAGTALNETSISWSWNASAGATYYEVRRFSDSALLATTTALSWAQSVVPNTAYQNYATACIAAGCGPASNNASVTTKLNKPTNFGGTGGQPGGTSILWNWTDNSAYETEYRIKEVGTGTIKATTTAGSGSMSKLETGLTAGTDYCRYATAYEASPSGESDPSDPNGASGVCVNTGAAYLAPGSLESPIFDTRNIGGAAYQYVMWRGSLPSNTSVDFRFASSNSATGPWSYVGSDCLASSRYTNVQPTTPVMITQACHTGQRYFRYIIYLQSNPSQTGTPLVQDVILGWSP